MISQVHMCPIYACQKTWPQGCKKKEAGRYWASKSDTNMQNSLEARLYITTTSYDRKSDDMGQLKAMYFVCFRICQRKKRGVGDM